MERGCIRIVQKIYVLSYYRTWHRNWQCPPRSKLDRSAYQPTQWTVATGRLIGVDTPTCDVKRGHSNRSLKPLGMANHAHTRWYNRSPLICPFVWLAFMQWHYFVCVGSSHRWTSHLQAGVEAAGLLVHLARRGVEPHEAVVAQDDGRSAGEVVEVGLLPFDQRRWDLHEHSLAQLTIKGTGRWFERKNMKPYLSFTVTQ